MKLSVEASVAAVVVACFAALSIGAIAQEQSGGGGSGGPNGYGRTKDAILRPMSLRGSESFLSRPTAKEPRTTVSDSTE